MANLKELAKKKEVLTGGHRLCSGCGAPIIIRQMGLSQDVPLVVGCATGCVEVSTTPNPFTAWECSFVHCAFENSAATVSGAEAAYKSLKRRGKVKAELRFVAIGGDGGTYDIGLQSLSGMLERGHRILYLCYNNEAYMNCLSASSMIMTKKGLKKITEIKEGDEVYAFDQNAHGLVLKRCTGVFDNGKKEVFQLDTLHHSVRATGNHPFLVLKRNGTGRQNGFAWKMLEEIKNGDEIVALKGLKEERPFRFGEIKKVEKGDYKVNKLNRINIPEHSSPELMEYLGLFVGDGWVRNGRGEVGFALPEGTVARDVSINLHSKVFASKVTADKDYVYANSINLANFINSLGFGTGAKNKTVPEWVFTLTREEKESFIEGLMLSDGYSVNGSSRYVSASPELLKTLRLLLQTAGYRVGKIHQQRKEKGEVCVYRKLLKDSEYGYICFSKRGEPDIEKYPSQSRYRNFLSGNEYFETEKVVSIKSVGIEPTLDLRVEGEHNFIADGIVVHNTGVQRSSATPRGTQTTTAPVGAKSIGKKQYPKDLTGIVVAHRIPFVAQASPSHWNDLITKSQKALSVDGPSFMNFLSPSPLGWAYPPEKTIELAKLAVDTCFWPLFEVENGTTWKLSYKPAAKKPITDYLKVQGRFRHLLRTENASVVEEIQKRIDDDWAALLRRCGVED